MQQRRISGPGDCAPIYLKTSVAANLFNNKPGLRAEQRQSDDDGEAYVLVVLKSQMIMAEVLDLIDKRRHWVAFGFILRQKMTAASR